MTHRLLAAAALAALPLSLAAQDFTTPEGAAMIHQSLKDQVLSFRQEGDTDYIYFTALLGWRCGVRTIYYGLNDDPPVTIFPMEPCYRELRDPNTLKSDRPDFTFFIQVPTGVVRKVTLRVVYEDGKDATFVSEREKNLVY